LSPWDVEDENRGRTSLSCKVQPTSDVGLHVKAIVLNFLDGFLWFNLWLNCEKTDVKENILEIFHRVIIKSISPFLKDLR